MNLSELHKESCYYRIFGNLKLTFVLSSVWSCAICAIPFLIFSQQDKKLFESSSGDLSIASFSSKFTIVYNYTKIKTKKDHLINQDANLFIEYYENLCEFVPCTCLFLWQARLEHLAQFSSVSLEVPSLFLYPF